MASSATTRRRRSRRLLEISFVLATVFAAGLVTSAVVAGAGPLSVLSDQTSTATDSSTDTTSTDETGTETTNTESTETETTEAASTETTTTTEAVPGGPCAATGNETLSTDAPDYAPGSIVQISGAGFAANCDVELRITRPDSVVETMSATTDEAGELLHEYLLPPPPGVIGTYRIDAYGVGEAPLVTFEFGDSRIVEGAALDGQASVTVMPGASIPVQVRVEHVSAGGTNNDWRSTRWTIGAETDCINHADFTNTATDTVSFNALAPASVGTFNATFVAYINDNCTGTEGSDVTLTLTNGVVVDDMILFTDRFGTSAANTVGGWTDGDAGGSDCAVSTLTPTSGPTSGFNNGYLRVRSGCITTQSGISTSGRSSIHLKYGWGQQTDNDATADGDLVVQWKRATDLTWITANTHPLANNTATNPTTGVDVSLPVSANNTSIDIRFWGNTPEDNDQGRVDNVIVTGQAAPVNSSPSTAANLAQFRSNGTTAIATGGFTNETSVVLKGDLSDPDASDMVKLEVEVKPVGTAFDGIGLVSGSFVTDPATASVTVPGLSNGVGYHWRARAVDDDGATSAFASFGGNAETAADFSVDTVKPTITGSAISPPGGAAYAPGTWTKNDVQVAFTCADNVGGSGIAASTVMGQTVSSEGTTASVSNTGSCADNAGNTADTASFGPIMIDKTKPTLTASATSPPGGAAYAAGTWTRFNVEVAFACADGLSGIGPGGDTVPDVTVSAEGTTASVASTGDCTDRAGNEADGASFGPVMIDKTKPTLSSAATSPPGGAAYSAGTWTRFNVEVAFACADGLSGIGPGGDTVPDVTISTEGANQSVTSTGNCTDRAGNEADTETFSDIDIDKTKPSLTASATSPPGGAAYAAGTWTRFNVEVAFACADGLSGIGPGGDTVPDVTVSAEGTTASVASSGDCTDRAGNEADGASFGPVMIDKTKPTLSSAATSPPGGAAYSAGTWTRFNVEVAFACADGLSGIGPGGDTVPDVTISTEGANQSVTSTGNCTDRAGNEADTETFSDIDIDKTKPSLTASATSPPGGAAYAAGTWTRFNVEVAFACADGLSGIGPGGDTVPDVTVSAEGTTASVASTGDCTDRAGNEADGASFGPVMIDKTKPTLSSAATSPPGGAAYSAGTWTRFNVEVTFACADALSGIGPGGDTVPDVTISTEGANQSVTSTGNCTDRAGNEADTETFSDIDIDKTKPTLAASATSPPGGAAYAAGTWTRFNVEVAFACADGLSGIGPGGDTVPDVTVSVEGSDKSVTSTGNCTDRAGNEADPATYSNIDIDKSNPNAPTVAADRPPDYAGGGGWYKDTVTVSFTDNGDPALVDTTPGSGVDPTSVPAPQTFTTSGAHPRTGTVKDRAGNESASASLTVQVDTKNPTFGACTGGPFVLGSGPQPVSITAADAGESGVNAGASTLSGSVDTSTIGTKNVLFTAVDNVGHSATKSCSYSVIFNFHGFFQPVDNNGVFNVVNSGRAIPVKFDLSGNQGLDIFAAGFPKSTVVPCNGAAGTDVLEETSTAGNSSLSYSEGQPFGQYHYVWKTEKTWANTCRRLDLKLVDGMTYSALFKFTK